MSEVDWKKEYDNLVKEISLLRDAVLSSEVDDSSDWYSSLISDPQSVIDWSRIYFKNRKIGLLTIEKFKNIVLPKIKNFYLTRKKLYYNNKNGEMILIQSDLNIPDWEFVKNKMEIEPELYLDSVLVNKMYKAILADEEKTS